MEDAIPHRRTLVQLARIMLLFDWLHWLFLERVDDR
jgi:hypothetical protein